LTFALAIASIFILQKNLRYQLKIIKSEKKAQHEAAEKSRFLAYMSHEFRNPLASVIGFAEQLEQTDLSDEQKNLLSGLMSSSDMLLTSVNDILDLSKLDAGKMSFLSNPFIPDETISQVMKSFAKMAGDKGIAMNYKNECKPLTLMGDEIRLKQVLNNLVSNALKYTIKGQVTITSKLFEDKATAMLKIAVTDTGMGIDPSRIDSIFDEYSRVHKETPEKWIIGTGLGLAVAKKMIDQMNGTIEVKSTVGKGSVFTINIPYPICTLQSNKKPKKGKLDPGSLENKRILVADDNYLNIALLKIVFKDESVTIDVAENGIEALEKLKASKYDILLSDMYMPEMDGIELTKQIRNSSESLCKIPVVMITGNITPEASEQMTHAGVSEYLLKPYQQKHLMDIVRKHLLN